MTEGKSISGAVEGALYTGRGKRLAGWISCFAQTSLIAHAQLTAVSSSLLRQGWELVMPLLKAQPDPTLPPGAPAAN